MDKSKLIKKVIAGSAIITRTLLLSFLVLVFQKDKSLFTYSITTSEFFIDIFLFIGGACLLFAGLSGMIFKKTLKPFLIGTAIICISAIILGYGYFDKMSGCNTIKKFLNCYKEANSSCINELFYGGGSLTIFFGIKNYSIESAYFSNSKNNPVALYAPAKNGAIVVGIEITAIKEIPNEETWKYDETEKVYYWRNNLIKEGAHWKITTIDYNI